MRSLNIRNWKSNKSIQLIFKILEKDDEETRFIGGCVRDLIAKRKKKYDVDIATTLKPKKVIPIHYNTFDLIKQDVEDRLVKGTNSELLILKPGQEFTL